MQYSDKIGKPRRIISLVPSITELLSAFDLDNEVIGITKFCIFPKKWFRSKTRVGGTKNVNLARVFDLKPDLIIANKEENDKEQIESLQEKIPIWLSDIKTFEDALAMISKLGSRLQTKNKADEIVQKIRLSKLDHNIDNTERTAAYMIWDKPMMVAGGDTYINSMMQLAGFNNVFAQQNRYPTVSKEELFMHKPEVLLLSSEPFPFKQKHLIKYKDILPDTKILLIDGTMFSWYGSRLVEAFPYFSTLKNNL